MTQDLKDLLLKDLSARLPYGVKCIVKSDGYIGVISSIESQYGVVTFDDGRQEEICDIKSYLFPLSSMTEEQRFEYHNNCDIGLTECGDALYYDCVESIDWLNKNHFDYRGLIPMGLAIDATGLNIY